MTTDTPPTPRSAPPADGSAHAVTAPPAHAASNGTPRRRGNEQVNRAWSGVRPRVSVVILTLNEEINIEDCVESCAWCDDVHVLDSGSTDRTADLALAAGARVHVHQFESFGKQRNWAIDNIPLKHEWVFHLDADERFTPELVEEMGRLLDAGPGEAGFHVPNKLMFMGRWLRFAGGYPTYQMRLFHKTRMRFMDYGHGQREDTDHAVGVLESPYLHYSFSKGLYDWFDKHNRYSSLEALQFMKGEHRLPSPGQLFNADPVMRRRARKELAYRLPFWPWLHWVYMMFVAGAALEGRAGWTYARLMSMYEQTTRIKVRMLKHAAAGAASQRSVEWESPPKPSSKVFEAHDRMPARGAAPPLSSTSPSSASAHIATPVPGVAPSPPVALAAEQTLPEPSPWTFREKVFRAIWMLVGSPVFRITFHNWYGVRRAILRLFGAKIAPGARLRPSVHVEIPWNIEIDRDVTVGDHAILYSLGTISIGARTIISQYAHLCAGTHDHTNRRFPLIRDPVRIGSDVWIGADAFVGPNVTVGRLSVLGARSSAYKNLDAQTVYVGNPARAIKKRDLR